MDLNVGGLADSIQPSDALFEQFGIQRQVKQYQMLRELKIASFTADLGTEQEARSVRLGEPRGVAIPLHQRESFMENTGLDGQVTSQGRIESFGFFNGATDHQDLYWIQFPQQFHQPKNSRVARQISQGLQPGVSDILSKFCGNTIQPMLRFRAWFQPG